MKNRKCKNAIARNSRIWSNNLIKFKKSFSVCRNIPDVEISLDKLDHLVTKENVIGRFNTLAKIHKLKTKRYDTISKEIYNLCVKLKVQVIRTDLIKRKVKELISAYQSSIKRDSATNFKEVFNIIKKNVDLLSSSESIFTTMTEEEDDGDEDDDIDATMFESDQSEDSDYVPTWRNKITKIPLKPAVTLCTDIKLSTNKTAKICQHLAKSGIKFLPQH